MLEANRPSQVLLPYHVRQQIAKQAVSKKHLLNQASLDSLKRVALLINEKNAKQ